MARNADVRPKPSFQDLQICAKPLDSTGVRGSEMLRVGWLKVWRVLFAPVGGVVLAGVVLQRTDEIRCGPPPLGCHLPKVEGLPPPRGCADRDRGSGNEALRRLLRLQLQRRLPRRQLLQPLERPQPLWPPQQVRFQTSLDWSRCIMTQTQTRHVSCWEPPLCHFTPVRFGAAILAAARRFTWAHAAALTSEFSCTWVERRTTNPTTSSDFQSHTERDAWSTYYLLPTAD